MGSSSSSSNRPLLPIPANLDPPFRCFCLQLPDDPEYITMLAGKLKELATWTSYEYAGHPGDRTVLVGIWDRVLEQLGAAMCCCDQTNAILQFQLQAIFNSWSSVTNNTEINIYAPVTTFVSTAGESAPEAAARVDALCYAVGVMVDLMCEATIQILTQQMNTVNLLAAGMAIVAAVAAYFTLGTTIIVCTAISSALLYGFSSLAGIIELPQLNNTSARQELACALRDALMPLAPTEANLWAAVDGLTGLSTDATAMLNVMKLLNTRAQDSKQIFQGFINALGEGQQLGLAGVLPPCPCPTECALFPIEDSGTWSVPTGTWDHGTNVITADGLAGITVEFQLPMIRNIVSIHWSDRADGFNDQTVVIELYDGITLISSQTLLSDYHNSAFDWTPEPAPPMSGFTPTNGVDLVRLINSFTTANGNLSIRDVDICWE